MSLIEFINYRVDYIVFHSYLEFLYSIALLKCLSFDFFTPKGIGNIERILIPANRSCNKARLLLYNTNIFTSFGFR